MLRNDSSDFYFLVGGTSGAWNDLRPFSFNLSTGKVTFGNNYNVFLGSSSTYTGTYYAHFTNTSGDTNIPTIGWVKARQDSDIRLKNNIENLKYDDVIEKYSKIETISYKFKEGVNNNTIHFGYKAQQLSELYDNAIYDIVDFDTDTITDGEKKYINDGVYRINYNNLHALHTITIQGLIKEINNLKEEIKNLSNKNI